MNPSSAAKGLSTLFLATWLAACGGGGGGELPPPAPAPGPGPAPSPAPTPAPTPAPSPAPAPTPAPAPLPVMPAPVGLSLFIGDDGGPGHVDATGRDARFKDISAITVDDAGNIYVIDQGKRLLRKTTPAGAVTTLTNPEATIERPVPCYAEMRDVAAGGDGHLYVLDQASGRLCRRTAAGVVTEVPTVTEGPAIEFVTRGPGTSLFIASRKALYKLMPGSAPAPLGAGGAPQFETISGIAADPAGNVYAADTVHGVRKVTPDGSVTTVASVPVFGPFWTFDVRHAITADAAGNVYLTGGVIGSGIVNALDRNLQRISPQGAVTAQAGSENLFSSWPVLAFDWASGRITYGTSFGIGRLSVDGVQSQVAGRYLAGPGAPVTEYPLGIDRAGNLVTADRVRASPVLRKITRAGVRVPYAAGRETISLAEPLPVNMSTLVLAMDAADNVYGAYARPRLNDPPQEVEVYRLDPSGAAQRILFARRGDANFMAPDAMAFGPGGEFYLTDGARRRIVRLLADGTLTEITPDQSVPSQYAYYAPGELSVSPQGRISLLTSFDDFRLYFVNGARQFEPLAGRGGYPSAIVDGTGAAARFTFTSPPVYDPDGTMIITDGSTVRKVTPAGTVTTLAGRPETTVIRLGALPGSMEANYGLVRDADGVFYFRSGGAILRLRLP